MSGFGGWANPNGVTHYVRPGDKVIDVGTGGCCFASQSASFRLGGPYYSEWSLERAKLLMANLGTERPLKLNLSALHDIAVYLEQARKYGYQQALDERGTDFGFGA